MATKVQTPDGIFESTVEAARHYGLSPVGAYRRARFRRKGWSWAEEVQRGARGERGPQQNRCPEGADRIGWSKFQKQKRYAAARGIDWELTFEEWWTWWQRDGHWERRGRHSDDLVMARFGDEGPYRLDNIYCATQRQNLEHKTRTEPYPGGLSPREKAELLEAFTAAFG